MTPEQQSSTAVADAATGPTSQATETPDAPGRDLGVVLEELDLLLQANPDARKELKAHRTLMGIAGDMAHTIAQNMKREDDTKAQREAMARLEAQMTDEAKANPEQFAQKWLAGRQAEKTRAELDEMRSSVEAELGETIGAAVSSLPEFKQLSREEVAALAADLAGKPKHEIMAAYTKAAVNAVAGKRLANEVLRLEAEQAKWRETELKKELAAALQEANAKRLKRDQAPSLAAGAAAPSSTEPPFDPKPGSAWNRWYEMKNRVRPL